MKINIKPAEEIVNRYCSGRTEHEGNNRFMRSIQDGNAEAAGTDDIIPLLQEIQNHYGYVPEDAVNLVAENLGVFPVDIYGVLTFYTQFYLQPAGQYVIRICQGTACHVMGARDLLDHLSELLGIRDGQTTKDGLFSIERVACIGCCGMAPVIAVGDDFYGRCTVGDLPGIIDKYRKGSE